MTDHPEHETTKRWLPSRNDILSHLVAVLVVGLITWPISYYLGKDKGYDAGLEKGKEVALDANKGVAADAVNRVSDLFIDREVRRRYGNELESKQRACDYELELKRQACAQQIADERRAGIAQAQTATRSADDLELYYQAFKRYVRTAGDSKGDPTKT